MKSMSLGSALREARGLALFPGTTSSELTVNEQLFLAELKKSCFEKQIVEE